MLLALFGAAGTFAQTTLLKGVVRDSLSGEPLFGVNVIHAPGKGVATDPSGAFSMPLPFGEYTIAFRVTSADGHPVSGTRTFTLTQDGTGTPGAPAAGANHGSPSSTADGGDSGGVAVWWFVVAAVVMVAGGLWFALRKPKA